MNTITDEQLDVLHRMVPDLIALRKINGPGESVGISKTAACVNSPRVNQAEPVARANGSLKRKLVTRLERSLCSLVAGMPPSALVNPESEQFKRMKTVLQERVAWKKWLSDHRAQWKEAREKREAHEAGVDPMGQHASTMQPQERQGEDPDAVSPNELDVIDEPCRLCNHQVGSSSEALICDWCQAPHHIPCLATNPSVTAAAPASRLPVKLTNAQDPEVKPSPSPALSVEVPEDLPVPLLDTGDWYCNKCHGTVAGSLYGKILSKDRPGRVAGRFGPLKPPEGKGTGTQPLVRDGTEGEGEQIQAKGVGEESKVSAHGSGVAPGSSGTVEVRIGVLALPCMAIDINPRKK